MAMSDVDNDERLCFLCVGELGDPYDDKLCLFTADMATKCDKMSKEKTYKLTY